MKILVSGLVNIETNVNVGDFPIQYSPIEYAFDKINVDISGVAYNLINSLHTLGDEIVPVTLIGKDNVSEIIKTKLEQLSFTTEYIRNDLEHTCTSVVLYDEKGARKIYCDLKDIQSRVVPFAQIKEAAMSCDGLIICNINFNDELIRQAKSLNKPVFTDVHVLCDINDEYNSRFLENADVVFLSDEGLPCEPEIFIQSIYDKYHNKVIVLGQGAKGALLFEGEQGTFTSVPSVYTRPVVNTVGAGDALFSCFVHFYLKGLKPVDALRKAVKFASYKIGVSGGAKGFIDEAALENLESHPL